MCYTTDYRERLKAYTDVDCCFVTRLVHTPVCVIRALFPDPALNPRQEVHHERGVRRVVGRTNESIIEEG